MLACKLGQISQEGNVDKVEDKEVDKVEDGKKVGISLSHTLI